ncbi:MAG TPA: class I SAM-dependent methyltransferase [Geminicoccaceae bacterium]
MSAADEDAIDLFASLPRQGPGSAAATGEALARLGPLPDAPRTVDLGCGSGAATLVLAERLGSRIVAVDREPRLLRTLGAAAAARGLAHLIEPLEQDFASLRLAPGSFDLLWSEGAIYTLGLEAGLGRWRVLLAPGGKAAVSDLAFLDDHPPPEVAAFWRAAYPSVAGLDENARRIARAGFAVLDRFVLPEAAWWREFYVPLLERCAALEAGAGPALSELIAGQRREIELFRRHHARYGYVFWLLQRGG